MFLIVATHYVASDDSPSPVRSALAQSWKSALHAVTMRDRRCDIFVLISAYFLSRSTRSPFTRVAKIWIQTFIYSCGLWGALFVLSHRVGSSQYFCQSSFCCDVRFPCDIQAYWFISAYVVMVIVAPYINILLDATLLASASTGLLCYRFGYHLYLAYFESQNTWRALRCVLSVALSISSGL